jgi:hypothetical protein
MQTLVLDNWQQGLCHYCPAFPTCCYCQVNLINANIDPVSKRHMKQHPRVKAGAVWTKESHEWGGMMGELGLGMDDDGMPSDDLDSDDDQGKGAAWHFEAKH